MDTHPREIKGIQGRVDRIGVKEISVPYYARSLEECASVARGRLVDGLPEDSRSWQPGEGAVFIVTVNYCGKEVPSTRPEESEVQAAIDTSWEEEPIEMHPKINEIIEKYAGDVDPETKTVTFSRFYVPGRDGGRGLPGNEANASTQERNPFFGVFKYKKLSVIYTRTYAISDIPNNLLRRVGKVVANPPGSPPELTGRTKWLVLPVRANRRGNVVEVTESYQLLDEQVPDLMYDKAT